MNDLPTILPCPLSSNIYVQCIYLIVYFNVYIET